MATDGFNKDGTVEEHVEALKTASHKAASEGNLPLAKVLQRTAQFVAEHPDKAEKALGDYKDESNS
jgi:hypothetical protein